MDRYAGTIAKIAEFVKDGPRVDLGELGNITGRFRGDLVVLCYTHAAQYNNTWSDVEMVCRGLILNWRTGEVVARPFDRFYNWGQGGRRAERGAYIETVTEKMDGSLGILYRRDGKYQIATKGSFDSEQAIWASNWLRFKHSLRGASDDVIPDELTFLFEIIYPENRIVVPYGDRRELTLLAVRNRFTGEYLPFYPDMLEYADRFGFGLPRTYHFNSMTDLLEARERLTVGQEGWVIEFSNGERFKIKGDSYLEAHRMLSGATFKRVLDWVASGQYEAQIAGVPDEYLEQVKAWKAEIDQEVEKIEHAAWTTMQEWNEYSLPFCDVVTRKDFALWVREGYAELAPYLFRLYDGGDILSMIYKRAFKDREGK